VATSAQTIVRSALWAAYGDALGFITELAPLPKDVRRRAGVERITELVEWKRRVGGKFGVTTTLPVGCYSDDTQLRLATSRSIGRTGDFDVDAFAKVELPVWLSYALGGGRGTKTAASALARSNATWSTNFFSEDGSRYVAGGGNGAAMRIQPHVWITPQDRLGELHPDVIRNSVCTHGHPRGILGAVLHSLFLADTVREGAVPSPPQWLDLVERAGQTPALIGSDSQLSALWLPLWERQSGQPFAEAFAVAVAESRDQVRSAGETLKRRSEDSFVEMVQHLGGFDPSTRGAGTASAIAAGALAWLGWEKPSQWLVAAVNLLGSDTDTIATMAGAMLGAVVADDPPAGLMDHDYLVRDASRLAAIAGLGKATRSFPYPDLLKWSPPRNQVDAIGLLDDDIAVAGMGAATPIGEFIAQGGKGDSGWQWLKTWFGQTVLAKRRLTLRPLPASSAPLRVPDERSQPQLFSPPQDRVRSSEEHEHRPPPAEAWASTRNAAEREPGPLSVAAAIAKAESRDYSAAMIGNLIIQLSTETPNGIDNAIAFAALVARELSRKSKKSGDAR
jgi:ADP-ribosylglycohydrolase